MANITTIVGKNDAGKSSILRALNLFFEGKPVTDDDFNDGAALEEKLTIQVSFCQLPETIQIEPEVTTTLKDEMLLDPDNLTISKSFTREGKLDEIALITQDYIDPVFAELTNLKEADLNKRCKDNQIEADKSGRGITNKDKRKALRDKAEDLGIKKEKNKRILILRDPLWKCLEKILPTFYLYESERDIDVGGSPFQKEFKPIINQAVNNPEIANTKSDFTMAIEKALQSEIDEICKKLQKHTDVVTCLTAKPVFSWDKAVVLNLNGKDKYGIDKPLEKRGTGIRRLLMVSFFEHLAQKECKPDMILGIEEPENGLHPGLQRELVQSFARIADNGCQVIITTHSPVFAGSSAINDLVLIVREKAIAKVYQKTNLEVDEVAKELGIEPSDQIMGYNACVFVEGADDVLFWEQVSEKLKSANVLPNSFSEKKIGLVIYAGDNLKHWINMGTMKKLSRKFIVIKDSDHKKEGDVISEKVKCWGQECENAGGKLFCLRKREIENYLHRDVLKASGKNLVDFDDYSDMKKLFGNNVIKLFKEMSADQILERDRYFDGNGAELHELKEIAKKILSLC